MTRKKIAPTVLLMLAVPGMLWAAEGKPRAGGFVAEPEALYQSVPKVKRLRGFLPEAVDLSNRMPVPGNQGELSSCTAWAVAYAARSYYAAGQREVERLDAPAALSPAYVFNRLSRGNCSAGTSILDALNVLKTEGVVPLSDFPYALDDCRRQPTNEQQRAAGTYRIEDWNRLDTDDLDAIKGQLAKGHPVIVVLNLPLSFDRAQGTAIYRDDKLDRNFPHVMVVVGYSDKLQAFRLMNSWDTDWGDDGFIWISYPTYRQLKQDRAYVITGLAPPGKLTKAPANPVAEPLATTKVALPTGATPASPPPPAKPAIAAVDDVKPPVPVVPPQPPAAVTVASKPVDQPQPISKAPPADPAPVTPPLTKAAIAAVDTAKPSIPVAPPQPPAAVTVASKPEAQILPVSKAQPVEPTPVSPPLAKPAITTVDNAKPPIPVAPPQPPTVVTVPAKPEAQILPVSKAPPADPAPVAPPQTKPAIAAVDTAKPSIPVAPPQPPAVITVLAKPEAQVLPVTKAPPVEPAPITPPLTKPAIAAVNDAKPPIPVTPPQPPVVVTVLAKPEAQTPPAEPAPVTPPLTKPAIAAVDNAKPSIPVTPPQPPAAITVASKTVEQVPPVSKTPMPSEAAPVAPPVAKPTIAAVDSAKASTPVAPPQPPAAVTVAPKPEAKTLPVTKAQPVEPAPVSPPLAKPAIAAVDTAKPSTPVAPPQPPAAVTVAPKPEAKTLPVTKAPPVEPAPVSPPLGKPAIAAVDTAKPSIPIVPPQPPAAATVAPKPVSKPLRQRLEELLATVPCADIKLNLKADGRVGLSGFAGDADRLLDTVRAEPGVRQVQDEVQRKPWPQCEILLNFKEPIAARRQLNATLLGGQQGVFRDGDTLSIDIKTPDYPVYLYVSYLQASGEVAHLSWPAGAVMRPLPPASRIRLGGGLAGQPNYRISPPLGEEALIVVASRSPLFLGELPKMIDDRDYLSHFRRAFAVRPTDDSGARQVEVMMLPLRTEERRP